MISVVHTDYEPFSQNTEPPFVDLGTILSIAPIVGIQPDVADVRAPFGLMI